MSWVPILSRAGAGIVARAAGRQLARYAPRLAGAAAAAGAARLMSRKRKRGVVNKGPSSKKPRMNKAAKRRKMLWSGRYTGRFRRGTKKQANVYMKDVQLGFAHTQEVTGTVADPDAVYIAVSSEPADTAIYYMCCALVKKMLIKRGYSIVDLNTSVKLGSGTCSQNWYIYDENMNVLGSGTFVSTATVAQMASAIQSPFNLYAQGRAGQPYMFKMNDKTEYLDTGVYIPQDSNYTELRLSNLYVHVKVMTETKVQNRTLAEDNSAQTTDILKSPLDGYIYEFNRSPIARTKYLGLLETINVTDGVALTRAAQLGSTGPRGDPPVPKYFANVKRARAVVLNPGEIKKSVMWYNKRCNLLTWLKLVRDNFDGSATTNYSYVPHQIIALNDMLNMATNTNKVTVAYQVSRYYNLYVTEKLNEVSAGTYQAITKNNTS